MTISSNFRFPLFETKKRVPLGFVCGYPVGNGGEQYGGSMFIKSAATDTLQGRAIQAVNEKWGGWNGRWLGRETIGIPVCKKKYAPFSFKTENGVVKVERMFGCRMHSEIRKEKINEHGVRKGWEPFGQWSMRKAQELARKQTARNAATVTAEEDREAAVVSSDDEVKTICLNGNCAWKMREKYDNIHREVTGIESSDEEC